MLLGRTIAIVTITYPNGQVLNAIVLSHDEHEVRASAPGYDDVLAFTCFHGLWISDDGEPVTIEFEWQRCDERPAYSETDFICAKELAARLIAALLRSDERDEAVETAFLSSAHTELASPFN